jgi:acyl carrier protein
MDSGATVAIIMLVEEKFEVEFSAQELKEFRNVDGLMQMLRRHKV